MQITFLGTIRAHTNEYLCYKDREILYTGLTFFPRNNSKYICDYNVHISTSLSPSHI